MRRRITMVVLAALLLAGCAPADSDAPEVSATPSESATEPSGPPSTQPPSRTDPPTLPPPTAPPRTPTDALPGNVVAGRVTSGGTGPCYTVETDDGVAHVLYSDAGTRLDQGAVVRVWFEPGVGPRCGSENPRRLVKVEIVRS